jgi:acetyl-CoA C-acetyltransferase
MRHVVATIDEVYIVDGSRTPFIKARGKPGPFTPVDLAVQCGRPLLLRQAFAPDAFDQVILGCVNVIADEMNPARVAALRLGTGEAMTGFTMQINCGSGMQSIDTAYRYIQGGISDLILAGGAESLSHAPLVFNRRILAGGAESLSHAPLVFNRRAVGWFARLNGARDPLSKVMAVLGFRLSFLTPVIELERGLTDPIADLGQTAELVEHLFHISRRQADGYAAQSQNRLARAHSWTGTSKARLSRPSRATVRFTTTTTAYGRTTADSLAKLKPAFERPWGKVTPGNSSQINRWRVVGHPGVRRRGEAAQRAAQGRDRRHRVVGAVMGLGPVYCSTALMKRHNLSLNDIELWELSEAFAAQVLGCLAAWEDVEFCRDALGLDAPPRDGWRGRRGEAVAPWPAPTLPSRSRSAPTAGARHPGLDTRRDDAVARQVLRARARI